MAVETLYRIKIDGKWINSSGSIAPAGDTSIATFDTLALAETFIDTDCATGEYSIVPITTKT